jgi:hypothetical protein
VMHFSFNRYTPYPKSPESSPARGGSPILLRRDLPQKKRCCSKITRKTRVSGLLGYGVRTQRERAREWDRALTGRRCRTFWGMPERGRREPAWNLDLSIGITERKAVPTEEQIGCGPVVISASIAQRTSPSHKTESPRCASSQSRVLRHVPPGTTRASLACGQCPESVRPRSAAHAGRWRRGR